MQASSVARTDRPADSSGALRILSAISTTSSISFAAQLGVARLRGCVLLLRRRVVHLQRREAVELGGVDAERAGELVAAVDRGDELHVVGDRAGTCSRSGGRRCRVESSAGISALRALSWQRLNSSRKTR